jgi:DNA helicase-2/ATP-dependent DNA helicase PcrA
MLANWVAFAATATIPELFDRILKDVNYKEYIVEDESEESKDRWDNVQELKRLAMEYSTRTLDEFLENIALVADQDTITDANAPTLLTLHAAKGLEFGAVFIVGLDDGIIPHSRSFDEVEQMEEERRLFYVGITRAKDKLYLIRALQRGGRGMAESTEASRFLADVPAHLVDGKTRAGRSTRSGFSSSRTSRDASDRWTASPAPKSAPLIQSRYPAGTRVQHLLWDEGIVIESRLQDGDEILTVQFASGVKRLAASIANLKVI